MTRTTNEPARDDVSWRGLVRAALIVGAVLTLLAPLVFELGAVISVAVGAALAVANLWLLSLLVRRLLSPRGARLPWTLVALFKLGALFGGMFLLVSQGWCELWPLTLGYAALPLGIFFAQLAPAPA